MTAIIDYGAGNIRSVEKALRYLGDDCYVTNDPKEIRKAGRVILPGVGAFGKAMDSMRASGLEETVKEVAKSGTPFLGICLGLQLLFPRSEESPNAIGLALLDGEIVRFSPDPSLKVPHMGWNSLELKNDGRLFKNLPDQPYVYFVHSYYLKAKNRNEVKASCNYGIDFDASVESGNVFACQFHPEKSGETGLQILKNFLEI